MSDAPLILLIEDEAAIRKFVRAALVEQGYRVIEAETGKQGLTQAMTQPPATHRISMSRSTIRPAVQTKLNHESENHKAKSRSSKVCQGLAGVRKVSTGTSPAKEMVCSPVRVG
jgi:CheY-like chemotaxis protein